MKKNIKRPFIHLFIYLFLILGSALFVCPSLFSAVAKESVGHIVAARGKVTAISGNGEIRELSMKSQIYKEDTIKTDQRGRTQIMFVDNTIISLGRSSEMVVEEYEFNSGQNDGMIKTRVNEGVFRVMGGKIAKVAPQKFTTETLSATIGIRGSTYAGVVEGESLSVVLEGGTGIEVTNKEGTVLISKVGYGTSVPSQFDPPSPPRILPLTFQGDIVKSGSTSSTRSTDEDQLDEDDVCNDCTNPNENVVLRSLPGKYQVVIENRESLKNPTADINGDRYENIYAGEAESKLYNTRVDIEYDQFYESGSDLSFSFDLKNEVALPGEGASYTGSKFWYYNQPVTVGSTTFNLPARYEYSDLHEFYIMSAVEIFVLDEKAYTFSSLAFTGIPSTSLPDNLNVNSYTGRFLKLPDRIVAGRTGSNLSDFEMKFNRKNKKVYGVLKGDYYGDFMNNIYFMGDVDDNLNVDMAFFGFGGNVDWVEIGDSVEPGWISGSSDNSSSQFFGSRCQGFGFFETGNGTDLNSGETMDDHSIVGAAFLDNSAGTTPGTGKVDWEGFATNIFKVNNAAGSETVLMNSDPSNFSINIDRDNGNVTSALSVTDGTNSLSLSMGDGTYVNDDAFIAIEEDVAAKKYSLMVTADADKQFSGGDVYWGYWGSYTKDESGKILVSTAKGGYWLAGKRTTQDQLNSLLTGMVGAKELTYSGKAYGYALAGGSTELLSNGKSSVTFDFDHNTVEGKLDFSQVDIEFTSNSITNGGFNGTVTNLDSGSVNGALYGSTAGTCAGNFEAVKDSTTYTGIYGASKQ